MRVTILGTGDGRGPGGAWPDPFCGCAACRDLRRAAQTRHPTGALIDGILGLDPGLEPLRRWGADLPRLRGVLLSGDLGPDQALLQAWARSRPDAGVLVGPAAALDAAGCWATGARLVPAAADQRLEVEGYHVHARRGGPAGLAYGLDGPAGGRLLYAPAGLALPLAPEPAAAYDAVLLGGGEATVPDALAELRRVGAVDARTDVLVVGLGHTCPPSRQLARRVSQLWGARAVPDGSEVRVAPGLTVGLAAGEAPEGRPQQASRVGRLLVLGGARSGKSLEAERRVAAEPSVTYVATGGRRDGDAEWAERVAAHRARRPAHWATLETTDLTAALRDPQGALLVDCLSLWLAAVLDAADAWDGERRALDRARTHVDELVAAWRDCPTRVVAVSNEVGSGIVPATPSGRLYRDELGRLNARVAAESDEVVLLVAGQVLELKGAWA